MGSVRKPGRSPAGERQRPLVKPRGFGLARGPRGRSVADRPLASGHSQDCCGSACGPAGLKHEHGQRAVSVTTLPAAARYQTGGRVSQGGCDPKTRGMGAGAPGWLRSRPPFPVGVSQHGARFRSCWGSQDPQRHAHQAGGVAQGWQPERLLGAGRALKPRFAHRLEGGGVRGRSFFAGLGLGCPWPVSGRRWAAVAVGRGSPGRRAWPAFARAPWACARRRWGLRSRGRRLGGTGAAQRSETEVQVLVRIQSMIRRRRSIGRRSRRNSSVGRCLLGLRSRLTSAMCTCSAVETKAASSIISQSFTKPSLLYRGSCLCHVGRRA